MKPGRSDPCPCGSGLEAKRCCGVDSVRRRARLAAEAAAELFDLAAHFPRYRPATAAFDAWASDAPPEPSEAAIDAGFAELDEAERERIVGGFAGEYPRVWTEVLADFGNDDLAVEIVLKGGRAADDLARGAARRPRRARPPAAPVHDARPGGGRARGGVRAVGHRGAPGADERAAGALAPPRLGRRRRPRRIAASTPAPSERASGATARGGVPSSRAASPR